MAENSAIEWTDHTFNPWVGCVKVSEGCKYCYAEDFMTKKPRWANTWGPAEITERIKTKTWSNPVKWNKEAKESGKRVRVFCASLADVFEDNPQLVEWRTELLDLIINTPHLDWQILTKRPENVNRMIEQSTGFSDAEMWFHAARNVWMGTSVENQEQADIRIPELLNIPAAVRFLSMEPLLGPININKYSNIDWVIVGGESGPKARPMHPDWVRSLRDQCQDTGAAFFFKQWGKWGPVFDLKAQTYQFKTGREYPEDKYVPVYRIGKKKAGRLLDGKEWSGFPSPPCQSSPQKLDP